MVADDSHIRRVAEGSFQNHGGCDAWICTIERVGSAGGHKPRASLKDNLQAFAGQGRRLRRARTPSCSARAGRRREPLHCPGVHRDLCDMCISQCRQGRQSVCSRLPGLATATTVTGGLYVIANTPWVAGDAISIQFPTPPPGSTITGNFTVPDRDIGFNDLYIPVGPARQSNRDAFGGTYRNVALYRNGAIVGSTLRVTFGDRGTLAQAISRVSVRPRPRAVER